MEKERGKRGQGWKMLKKLRREFGSLRAALYTIEEIKEEIGGKGGKKLGISIDN